MQTFVVVFHAKRPPGRVQAKDLDWARMEAWCAFGSSEGYRVMTEDEYEVEKLIQPVKPVVEDPSDQDCA